MVDTNTAAATVADTSPDNSDDVFFAGADLDYKDEEIEDEDRGDEVSDETEDGEPEPESDPKPEPEPEEAEVEEEPEPEEEENAEAETAPAEEKPDRRGWIPEARFKEVNRRRREAEQRLRELEQQQQTAVEPPKYDFEQADIQYYDAVQAGEKEKAQKLRQEIRQAEMAYADYYAQQRATEVAEANSARSDFLRTAEELNKQFPQFDPDAGEGVFMQELVDDALELYDGLNATGKYSPGAALRRAANLAMIEHGISPQAAAGKEPPAQAKAKAPAVKKTNVVAKRRIAKQQPPDISKTASAEEAETDLEQMSEEEWDALPESKLRQLRGDFL